MKFNNTLSTCIQADIDNNIVPLLLGEPGIGKSSWVEDLAAKMHTKCFTLACTRCRRRRNRDYLQASVLSARCHL